MEAFSLRGLMNSAEDMCFGHTLRDKVWDGTYGLLIICGTGKVMEGMRQHFDVYTWG